MKNNIEAFFNDPDVSYTQFMAKDSGYVIEKLRENYQLNSRAIDFYQLSGYSKTRGDICFALSKEENKVNRYSVLEIIDFLSSDLKDIKNYINFFDGSISIKDKDFYIKNLILNTKTMEVLKVSAGITFELKGNCFPDWIEITNFSKYIIDIGYNVEFKERKIYYKGMLLNNTISSIIPLEERYRGIFPKNLKIFSYSPINDGVLFCGEGDGSKDYDTILDERSKIDKNFIKASRLMISITQEEKEIHRFEEIDFNKSVTLSHNFNCGVHWCNEDEYNELNAKIDIEVLGKTQFDKAIKFYEDISQEDEEGYELYIEDGEEELRKIAQEIKNNIPYKNKVYLESIWHSANHPSYFVIV